MTADARTPHASSLGVSPSDLLLRELAHTGDAHVEPDHEPGSRVGRFEIERVLGRGGMGVVYAATDVELGRPVALKLLHPRHLTADERRRRFLREARAAAAVDHPNVARILEVGDDPAGVYLVFERVDGATLRAHARGRTLAMSEIARLGDEIASALGAAHDKGVVHRDLKPDNVIVSAAGPVKVLDFGLAKLDAVAPAAATSDVITEDGHILGSPGYMAPEQALGRETTSAADVFSLGVVLFELATGERPFSGDGAMETIVSTTRDRAPDPRARRRDLPARFGALVRRCLEKDPGARPPVSFVRAELAQCANVRHPSTARWALALSALLAIGVVGVGVRPRAAPAHRDAPEVRDPPPRLEASATTAAATVVAGPASASDARPRPAAARAVPRRAQPGPVTTTSATPATTASATPVTTANLSDSPSFSERK